MEMEPMQPADSDAEGSERTPSADENAMAELNKFFSAVEEIKEVMTLIMENSCTMKGLYSKMLTSTSTEEDKELRKEVDGLRTVTDKVAQQMRVKIKTIRKENDEFANLHDNDPSLVKIRLNIHGSLVCKFLNLMQEHQAMLTKYDKKFRAKVYKEVQIEQIDEVLEAGVDEAIFQRNIMEDRKHAKATQTLQLVKHNDLLAIEESIFELNQIFMDMAILIETQGDLIDQIEFSVMNSKAYIEKGVATLDQTKKTVFNTRKKKVCVVVTVIVILALVIVIAAIVLGVMISTRL